MSFPIAIIIMLIAGIAGGTVNFLLPSNLNIETNKKVRKLIHCVILGVGATILVPLFLEIAQSKLLDDIHLGYSWQNAGAKNAINDSVNKRSLPKPGIKNTDTRDSLATDSIAIPGNPDDRQNKQQASATAAVNKNEAELPLKNYLLFASYCFLAAAAGLRFINNIIDSVLKDKQIATLKDQNAEEKKAKEEAEEKKEIAEQERKEAEAKKLAAEKEKEMLSMQNKVNLLDAEQTLVTQFRQKTVLPDAVDWPSIAEILVPGDPQKGRFGGVREVNNKKLAASVTKSMIPMFYDVTIWVEATNKHKLQGDVIFYLHDTFANPIRVVKENDFEAGKASVGVKAWGAFTVGAVCDNGETLLEFDLSEDTSFPKKFRER